MAFLNQKSVPMRFIYGDMGGKFEIGAENHGPNTNQNLQLNIRTCIFLDSNSKMRLH